MSRIANSPPQSSYKVVRDRWSEPFWAAAGEGRLTCAKCGSCGRFRMPPTPFCPNCRSQAIEWPSLPGTGTIYSYTIVERAVLQGTEDSIPYVPAVISLDGAGDARLISAIVESDVEDVMIGVPVRVLFEPLAEGGAVPRFTIVKDGQ